MSLKPIETVYKGYHFRSRLEARWAVFFDALKIKYQYEPEGFKLSNRSYLPDFRLFNVNLRTTKEGPGLWVEIKPDYDHSEDAYDYLFELAKGTGIPVALLVGPPFTNRDGWMECEMISDGHFQIDVDGWDNCMTFAQCYNCGRIKFEFLEGSYMYCNVCNDPIARCEPNTPQIRKACEIARQYRF